MGIDEGSVATTALVIAISAFVIACGQLLQQLFATADGLRRCQNSVIGGWSQLVQLRFRWCVLAFLDDHQDEHRRLMMSSFRFEVRIATPHFVIARPSYSRVMTSIRKWDKPPNPVQKLLWKRSRFWCDASQPVGMVGTEESHAWTSLRTIETAFTEEPVTWLSLIEDIHELQSRHGVAYQEFGIHADADLLCFTRQTRSWDFMPVEIVRPFASTTIGCLVSFVHRIGLTWVDFKPDEGIIRATGRGRSISASRIRGLGLVIEYVRNGTNLVEGLDRGIDSEEADKMACGILPYRNQFSHGWDLLLRDQNRSVEAQLSPAFRFLTLDDTTVEVLHQSLAYKTSAHALPGFADLLGLWTGWLPISSHRNNLVENPFPIEVEPMGRRPESRVVWKFWLQQHPSDSPQIRRVVEIYNVWESLNPTKFQTLHGVWDGRRPEFFKEVFDETQLYFDRYVPGFYRELVTSHIVVNAQSFKQAEENIRTMLDRPHPQSTDQSQWDPIFTERAFVYAENIPKIVEDVALWNRVSNLPPIEEAWWMMMLRMQAWNMGVDLMMRQGLTVPHYYYGDPSRVYIL